MSKKKLTCSRKDCNGCAKERTEAHCTSAKTTLFTSMLGPNEHHVGITVVLWERNPMDSSEEKALYPFISPEKRTEKRTEKKITGVSSDLQHLYSILYTLFLISCLHI